MSWPHTAAPLQKFTLETTVSAILLSGYYTCYFLIYCKFIVQVAWFTQVHEIIYLFSLFGGINLSLIYYSFYNFDHFFLSPVFPKWQLINSEVLSLLTIVC